MRAEGSEVPEVAKALEVSQTDVATRTPPHQIMSIPTVRRPALNTSPERY